MDKTMWNQGKKLLLESEQNASKKEITSKKRME